MTDHRTVLILSGLIMWAGCCYGAVYSLTDQHYEDLKALTEFALSMQHYELLPATATFYNNIGYTGQTFVFNREKLWRPPCQNVPSGFRIRSVNTSDSCVRAYQYRDCTGENNFLTPVSFDHNRLGSWGENIQSVGQCSLFKYQHANIKGPMPTRRP